MSLDKSEVLRRLASEDTDWKMVERAVQQEREKDAINFCSMKRNDLKT
jgi:hypothetical protein